MPDPWDLGTSNWKGDCIQVRVVVDTNVLISALGWKGGPEYLVVSACIRGMVTMVLSPDIIDEFKRVALRPKLGFLAEEVDEFITALLETCEFVLPSVKHEVIAEDPSDNKFLDVAIAGGADYIISGDRHLLDVKQYEGIRILRSPEMLELLNTLP